MNKPVFYVIAAVILIVVAGAFYFFTVKVNPLEINNSLVPTGIVGGDKDEHGCIGSAGYQWCEPKNKCLRVWEEACYSSPEQEIQYLLAEKYSKPASDVSVVARQSTADHFRGSVYFRSPGLPFPGEGGLVLAVKQGNAWQLVFDGNGSVDCQIIKNQYGFAQNMLAGICD